MLRRIKCFVCTIIEFKLLVCPSRRSSLARPRTLRGFLCSCLRQKNGNLSQILIRCTTYVWSLWFKRPGRVILAIWVAGKFFNIVFSAACPFEKKRIMICFLLAASYKNLTVRLTLDHALVCEQFELLKKNVLPSWQQWKTRTIFPFHANAILGICSSRCLGELKPKHKHCRQ